MQAHLARAVTVPAGGVKLEADVQLVDEPRALVLFAHGSGSSRRSARNRHVARALGARRLATVLLDLLTPSEDAADSLDAHLRFDIPLLARRLGDSTDWLMQLEPLRRLPMGYFGASTGAAAALIAAAERPDLVRAVVSRGGRPDLALRALGAVSAPTLLIVGGADQEVLRLNQAALALLGGPAELAIVPGATHLFEEPGALDEVAKLAGEWFVQHLSPGDARQGVQSMDG